jgi:hypothetical protein
MSSLLDTIYNTGQSNLQLNDKIEQAPQEIDKAWELLYRHLEGCEDWGNGCKVIKEDFIELGKKEFLIIPLTTRY